MKLNPDAFPVFSETSIEEARVVPNLLAELQSMSRDCRIPLHSEDRVVYLGENKPRVREIGEKLNKLGGYDLMLWVAYQVPQHDQRELECAWHEIGEWQS
jgi:hypothetical protein